VQQRFLARGWQSEWVVFDRLSGDTHALSECAAAVFFEALGSAGAEEPGDRAALKPTLPADIAALEEARAHLKRLGLA